MSAKDISIIGADLFLIPVTTRVPLKFGSETLTSVVCTRVRVRVRGADGQEAEGWGETPLSVQWVWPGTMPYAPRYDHMLAYSEKLAAALVSHDASGHPMEISHGFQTHVMPMLLDTHNALATDCGPMPWLGALVAFSAYDIALHDAYAMLHGVPVYESYTAEYMNKDLSHFLEPAEDTNVSFRDQYPADYLAKKAPRSIPAWHLVGGHDPISEEELTGNEPDDGYPVLLRDWIARDGLNCLKIKLRGTDDEWDYQRLLHVGEIAADMNVDWLTGDFNCTVSNPEYVTDILDRLMIDSPATYGKFLYVEQPFPYEIEENRIDVHAVSARKPLFMDESAHDWKFVRLGRSLGWTGVALKTCKTQTGALLSLCWAKAHGMTLMVQDLTNPMLAQVPHVQLAAHAGTIMGVETNAMQFYPEASNAEAAVHPGLYKRRNGCVDWTTVNGPGFGYRIDEIGRTLPEPTVSITK